MEIKKEAARYMWVTCGAGLMVSVPSLRLGEKDSTTLWLSLMLQAKGGP